MPKKFGIKIYDIVIPIKITISSLNNIDTNTIDTIRDTHTHVYVLIWTFIIKPHLSTSSISNYLLVFLFDISFLDHIN